MKFLYTPVLLIFYLPHLASSKECSDSECVTLYCARGNDCQSTGTLTNYVPTCDENRFQFSNFDSVLLGGSGFEGTDCYAYSDLKRQNEMVDSGN
ncbi:hypothetical protein DFH09DRAFT_852539, partial [Mycena vulgaris]